VLLKAVQQAMGKAAWSIAAGDHILPAAGTLVVAMNEHIPGKLTAERTGLLLLHNHKF
jgi:hypothetical protein